jgi:hypothetical protein
LVASGVKFGHEYILVSKAGECGAAYHHGICKIPGQKYITRCINGRSRYFRIIARDRRRGYRYGLCRLPGRRLGRRWQPSSQQQNG